MGGCAMVGEGDSGTRGEGERAEGTLGDEVARKGEGLGRWRQEWGNGG